MTTSAGALSYTNYAHFEPVWNVKPPASSPPPPPAQTPSSAYIAEVAYLKTPLPNGTNFTPEASQWHACLSEIEIGGSCRLAGGGWLAGPPGHPQAHWSLPLLAQQHNHAVLPPTRTVLQAGRTALMTIAELQQNVSTQYTLFNWELSFEAQSGKPVPVKLEIVSYNASATPSNGKTILTLSSNSTGFDLLGTDIAGSEQREHCLLEHLSAWAVSALPHTPPPAPQCLTLPPSTPAAPLLGSSPPPSATPTMHACPGLARSFVGPATCEPRTARVGRVQQRRARVAP